MQIVYLSDRPELLRETLDHVRYFAPFIDDVVVVTPERSANGFDALGTVLTDEALTGLSSGQLQSMDHATRNSTLRAAVVGHAAIAETFVMSDDDSRPLVPIDRDFFINGEGQHRRRYFYALADWRHSATAFDRSLLHSWIVLRQRGYVDPLAYNSHLPQVIERRLYASVAESLTDVLQKYPVDEWSPYFAIAATLEPDLFADPEPFVTLGWPTYPGEWPHQVIPPQHAYENFHPELYEAGGLYDGLATGCDPDTVEETNLEKIVRWYRLERQVRELDFPDDVDQPWSSPNQGRKLAFRGLKAARSAYRYLNLDERARISELEGRLQRLEKRAGD